MLLSAGKYVRLLENDLPSHEPAVLFGIWLEEWRGLVSTHEDPNAVSISTAVDNKPSSRMVLMKDHSPDGITFFTNSGSRKGRQLEANPHASMLFYWPKAHRQVRVEGCVKKLPCEVGDSYWLQRPLDSRISQKASPQSTMITNEDLQERRRSVAANAAEIGEEAVARPPAWTAYLLRPSYFEFWQGQNNCLQDRICFSREKPVESEKGCVLVGDWHMFRLAP